MFILFECIGAVVDVDRDYLEMVVEIYALGFGLEILDYGAGCDIALEFLYVVLDGC